MNKLQKLTAILGLLAIFFVTATTTANAGILLSDLSQSQAYNEVCKESDEEKVDSGIIIHLGGIIVHFVGSVTGTDDTKECGIIVH